MAEQKKTSNPILKGSRHKTAGASPGFLFWKAFNNWSRQIRFELEKVDLTQVQYSILAATSYLCSTEDLVSQQDVANQLSMDKMMVSDVVKTLEKKKLMMRRPNPNDGRSFSLHLTSDAKHRLKQAIPIVEATDERFFGVLKSEHSKTFIECLAKLNMER